MKKCSTCLEILDIENFHKRGGSRKDFQASCKKCQKLALKKDQLENPERWKSYHQKESRKLSCKQWRLNNPDKVAAHKRKFYLKNKDKIRDEKREYNRKYNKNRANNDLNFKLSKRLRTRLGEAVRGEAKAGSAVRDLGCTIAELKIYLESKFQPGMTWENHTLHGWHIDHITPLCQFDLTNREEFLKACHYTNLQPLWAKDNLDKRFKK